MPGNEATMDVRESILVVLREGEGKLGGASEVVLGSW